MSDEQYTNEDCIGCGHCLVAQGCEVASEDGGFECHAWCEPCLDQFASARDDWLEWLADEHPDRYREVMAEDEP